MWCEILVEGSENLISASTSLSNSSVIVPSLDAAGGHADSLSPEIISAVDASIRSTIDEEKEKAEDEEAMKREVEETDEMIDQSIVEEAAYPYQDHAFTRSNSSHDDDDLDVDSSDADSTEEEEEDDDSIVYDDFGSDKFVSEDDVDEDEEDFVVLSDEDQH